MFVLQIDNPKLEAFFEEQIPSGKISSIDEMVHLMDVFKFQQKVSQDIVESLKQAERRELISIDEAFQEVEQSLLNESEDARH